MYQYVDAINSSFAIPRAHVLVTIVLQDTNSMPVNPFKLTFDHWLIHDAEKAKGRVQSRRPSCRSALVKRSTNRPLESTRRRAARSSNRLKCRNLTPPMRGRTMYFSASVNISEIYALPQRFTSTSYGMNIPGAPRHVRGSREGDWSIN